MSEITFGTHFPQTEEEKQELTQTYDISNDVVVITTSDDTVTLTLDGKTDIPDDFIENSQLEPADVKEVIIGKGITGIGQWAFAECENLVIITIPDSVTSIGYGAFNWCRSLISITIPDSVISIGDEAFLGCKSLTSITIPDSVTSIEDYAFAWCDNLTICCFAGSYAKQYARRNGIRYTTLREKTVTIITTANDTITLTLGEKTDIPDNFIPNSQLKPTDVKEVIIGKSITDIGEQAFKDCENLVIITIPDSVTSMEN